MQAIYILVWMKGVDDGVFVQMRGQGQLDQDAVDGGVLVEAGDYLLELGLGKSAGKRRSTEWMPTSLAILRLPRT